MCRLAGKTVLVTGAAGGCGREAVRKLLAEGASVRALVRDVAAANLPTGVDVYKGDVYDFESLGKGMPKLDRIVC